MDLILDDEQLKVAVSYVASTDEGRDFIAHLISISNAFTRGFHGNSKDDYLKGRSDFGLEIVEMMEIYADENWFKILEKDITQKKKERGKLYG